MQAIWLQTLLLEGVKPGTNTSVIPADVVQKAATGVSVSSGTAYVSYFHHLCTASLKLRASSQSPELSPVVYGAGQQLGTYRGHGKLIIVLL